VNPQMEGIPSATVVLSDDHEDSRTRAGEGTTKTASELSF